MLLSLFSGPYALLARWATLGIACLALFGYGWFKGNAHGTAKLTEYQAEQVVASVKVATKQAEVTEVIRTKYVDRVKTVKEKGDAIETLIPIYITSADDADCFITTGARIVHDSAADNKVPAPPSGTDGASSGLALSATLGTVTKNYTTYHEVAARLRALQDWTNAQHKLTE